MSIVVAIQSISCVWLFATPWTAACQASLTFTISWSLLKFMSIELVMLSYHLMLCHPLLLISIFPSIRVFSSESSSGGQSIGASASVLPMNIQDWFPFQSFRIDWLAWSPCCLRDSQAFSPAPPFESINSSALSLLYGPNEHVCFINKKLFWDKRKKRKKNMSMVTLSWDISGQ